MLWKCAVVILALACVVGSAQADFKPRVSLAASGNTGSVVINGEIAVRFQVSNGGLSGLERARITTDRIIALVNSGFNPANLKVQGDKNAARIYAGDQLICIATANDAKALNSKPLDVANKWASQIRTFLLLPAIALSRNEVTVPLGENRQVDIKGAASGPVSVAIDDAEIAGVTVQPDGRQLTVFAKKLGRALVEVSIQGERAMLVVNVRKYAGKLPTTAIGQVTGNPCPGKLVCYAARQAVAQNAVLEPGSAIEIGEVKCSDESLGVGKTRNATVNVRIVGRDYIPFSATASVQVRNITLPREEAVQLFYSNEPESIHKYQSLYVGRVDQDVVTRILYHHQSEMSKRVQVIVELINPNDTSAQMRIFRGISPPSVDTIYVGHVAANAFMRDCANDISVLETIPPKSRLVLVSDLLSTKQTSSGILQLKQMDGNSTYLRITAAEPGVDNVTRGSIARATDARVMQLSEHIYPTPIKTVDAEYQVGSRWAFISIGKHALTDSSAQKTLYGNYGVTYNINVRVHNPTDEAKKVSIVFDPSAGPCSGVFIVNGKFMPVKYAQPPTEVTLDSIMLNPGETKMCKVITVPLAGSNYPATVIVRS
jgi:hypothetical protein